MTLELLNININMRIITTITMKIRAKFNSHIISITLTAIE